MFYCNELKDLLPATAKGICFKTYFCMQPEVTYYGFGGITPLRKCTCSYTDN